MSSPRDELSSCRLCHNADTDFYVRRAGWLLCSGCDKKMAAEYEAAMRARCVDKLKEKRTATIAAQEFTCAVVLRDLIKEMEADV